RPSAPQGAPRRPRSECAFQPRSRTWSLCPPAYMELQCGGHGSCPYVSATYLIFSSNPEIRATKREGLPGPLTRQIRGPPGGVEPGPGRVERPAGTDTEASRSARM